MMANKIFRIDWYPQTAYADLSKLEYAESAVLMQIINLIYIDAKPIDNNPSHIGKSCNMRPSKCKKVINSLIHKGCITLTDDNKISQKRCMQEINAVKERQQKSSKSGQKGAETRWGSKQNQLDENDDVISIDMARTSMKYQNQKPIPISNGMSAVGVVEKSQFKIEYLLSDEDILRAKSNAPGWDISNLMRVYNEGINSGERAKPCRPSNAFIAWCKSYTKGVTH